MIWLYDGTPGSGKSLHAAADIYKRICRGKNVIANFDINMTAIPRKKRNGLFVYIDNCDSTPQLLIDLAYSYHKRNTNGNIIEGQTMLVFDECQVMFSNREWQASGRGNWNEFFRQHRKYGYNVILITQSDKLIDKQLRALIEYEVVHRKASNYKTLGFLLGLAFGGRLFVAVERFYCIKEKNDAEWFVMRRKYARLYDSYRTFGAPEVLGSGAPAPQAVRSERTTVKKEVRTTDYIDNPDLIKCKIS